MLENKILLASKSPRRRELLKLICADFEVDSADADEALPHNVSPSDAVLYLSKLRRSRFVAAKKPLSGQTPLWRLIMKSLASPKMRSMRLKCFRFFRAGSTPCSQG